MTNQELNIPSQCSAKETFEKLSAQEKATQKSVEELRRLLSDAGTVFEHIVNGHNVDDLKAGVDAMVEYGKIHYVIKKYKWFVGVILTLAIGGFFGVDLDFILKLIKG